MKTPKATVRFSINLRQDAKNWARVALTKQPLYGRSLADFTSDIPKNVLRVVRNMSRDRATTYIYHYLHGRQERFITDLKAMKALLEEYFELHGDALLKTVGRLMGKPIYRKTFFATFTLLSTCPYYYEKSWFMIPAKKNMAIQLKTICHEILHLQFIHYYHDYCRRRGLTEAQFQDLKEALTVLLNESCFRKYHLGLDVGYPAHIKLRKVIQRLWKKKTSFMMFLDDCIVAAKRDAVDH